LGVGTADADLWREQPEASTATERIEIERMCLVRILPGLC
jgi:hypothetical protein